MTKPAVSPADIKRKAGAAFLRGETLADNPFRSTSAANRTWHVEFMRLSEIEQDLNAQAADALISFDEKMKRGNSQFGTLCGDAQECIDAAQQSAA